MAIGDKLKGLFIQQEPTKPFALNFPEGFDESQFVENVPPELTATNVRTHQRVSFTESSGKWTSDVTEIYEKSSVAGELKNDNTIYKVGQLIAHLPKDLGKSDIQNSLVGILGVTNIAAAVLERDASLRQDVLTGYQRTSSQEMDTRTEELRRNIEEAEQRIEAAKQELADIRTARANIEQSVEIEMKKINELRSFLIKG